MYDRFEAMDTVVIATAQEDKSLEEHGRMLNALPDQRFDVVADLDREETPSYDRTTAYLIDKQGVVRQIFPMIIHARPSWEVVLDEMERLLADSEPAK
jgi:hypothetical protein